jgi:hypothetical protein
VRIVWDRDDERDLDTAGEECLETADSDVVVGEDDRSRRAHLILRRGGLAIQAEEETPPLRG